MTAEFVLVKRWFRKDNAYGEIKKLGEQYQNVRASTCCAISASAMRADGGTPHTEGDFITGMDDDMQTHPSQISKLIHKMEEGYDLVYGCYPKRKKFVLKNVATN